MIGSQQFVARIAGALATAADRLCDRLAQTVPPDVTVGATDNGVALHGVALAERALGDPRLRDFAGLLR